MIKILDFKDRNKKEYQFTYYSFESINKVRALINNPNTFEENSYNIFFSPSSVKAYRTGNGKILTSDGGMAFLFDEEAFSAWLIEGNELEKLIIKKFKQIEVDGIKFGRKPNCRIEKSLIFRSKRDDRARVSIVS